MKKVFKKNQVVITTLAVLIAIAGYLSYEKGSNHEQIESVEAILEEEESELLVSVDDVIETESITGQENDITNPGETVLTSAQMDMGSISAQLKLNREQLRSKNEATLLEVVNNVNLSEEQKQIAINQIVEMTQLSEKENAAELLLESKGFYNAVVSITNDTCDVVINESELTDAKRAQIEDIVKRKTGIAAEKIVITNMKPE